MLKKILAYFKGLAYKVRVNKFKKILSKHDVFILHGYVFRIVDIQDFYVNSIQVRTGWDVDIDIKHVRVAHNGNTIGLADIGLFF